MTITAVNLLTSQADTSGGSSNVSGSFAATGGGILVCFVLAVSDGDAQFVSLGVSGHGDTDWTPATTLTFQDAGTDTCAVQMFYTADYTAASAAVTVTDTNPGAGGSLLPFWVAEILSDVGVPTLLDGDQAVGTTTAAQATYTDASNVAAVAIYGVGTFVSTATTHAPINGATELTQFDGGLGVSELSGGYLIAPGATHTFGATLGVAPTGWQAHVAAFVESSATEQQSHYRFGLDDGTESGHTFAAAEDTPITAATATRRLLRMQIDNNTAGDVATGYRLQYRRTDEGATEWRDI